MNATSRSERIIARVRAIPPWFVSTYKDIEPGSPRLVGRVLAEHWRPVAMRPICLGIVSCAATVARRSERDSSNFCAKKAFPSAVTASTWTEPDSRPTGNRPTTLAN